MLCRVSFLWWRNDILLKWLFHQRCVITKFRTPCEIGSVKEEKKEKPNQTTKTHHQSLQKTNSYDRENWVMNSKTWSQKEAFLTGQVLSAHQTKKSIQFSHITVSHGLSPGQKQIHCLKKKNKKKINLKWEILHRFCKNVSKAWDRICHCKFGHCKFSDGNSCSGWKVESFVCCITYYLKHLEIRRYLTRIQETDWFCSKGVPFLVDVQRW